MERKPTVVKRVDKLAVARDENGQYWVVHFFTGVVVHPEWGGPYDDAVEAEDVLMELCEPYD
jgi:hypothetical protein